MDTFMALFPRGGGAHNTSSAATVAATASAGMSHLYPPRIACFVCGAEGPADYPIFAEPPPQTAERSAVAAPSAHFPFLLAHPPPMGCSTLKAGDARGTKSCRPCHMALMRQVLALPNG